jgi:hypothetical protein
MVSNAAVYSLKCLDSNSHIGLYVVFALSTCNDDFPLKKNKSLTEEELKIIEDVFQAIMHRQLAIIAARTAKSRALKETGRQKQKQKSLVTTYGYQLISEAIDDREEHNNSLKEYEKHSSSVLPNPFMPRDIRKNLPQELENIANASLRRILKAYERMRLVENKVGEPENRPHRRNDAVEDFGGRRSYYYYMKQTQDNNNNKVATLLSKPEAKQLLNHRIIESGLLFEWAKYYTLVLYHEIQQNPNQMLKTVQPHFRREEDSRIMIHSASSLNYYQRIRSLNENQLEAEAEKEALAYVEKHKRDPNLYKRMLYGISMTIM